MKTTIYYSVQNCGDGSAYPAFFDRKELADLDQEYQYEGWGEDCVGYLEIESDSPVTISDVQSKEEVLAELYSELYDEDGKMHSWEEEGGLLHKHYEAVKALD